MTVLPDSAALREPSKVLVVDDEPHVCRLIESALSLPGLVCTSVHSGRQARELLLQDEYDVVLLDLLMPGVSGMDLLKFISSRGLHTRAICMTGVPSSHSSGEALTAGACDFFDKPFDLPRLVESVCRAAAESRGLASDSPGRRASPGLDALTELPTFDALRRQLAYLRRRCSHQQSPCAAMVVDLDAFSRINFTHGHALGDLILAELASRLREGMGQETYLARGAGDEFLLLMPGLSADQTGDLARRLREIINDARVEWKGQSMAVTASIGVAGADVGFSISESELLERARLAMRVARAAGGNGSITYTDGMTEATAGANAGGGSDPSGLESMAGGGDEFLSQWVRAGDDRLKRTLLESAGALVRAVEAKDPYTRRHSEHVTFYAEHIARCAGVAKGAIESIRVAALLHDIGKIAVPDSVLTKPGRLSRRELAVVRRHPEVGAAILETITLLRDEARLVRHHHERWDGEGYPAGLRGDEIPEGSRILNVADSIDAMLMHRTYKHAYSIEQMLEELDRGAGGQFEPTIARQAIDWCRSNSSELILPTSHQRAKTA